jgi:predicted HTH domain antitoxin
LGFFLKKCVLNKLFVFQSTLNSLIITAPRVSMCGECFDQGREKPKFVKIKAVMLLIEDEIVQGTRMSEEQLRLEIAIALYEKGIFSFGQARRLAKMDWFSFRNMLHERNVAANYDEEDFEKDMEAVKSFPRQ